MTLNKGALRISVLRVLTLLESGFRFSHRKSVVFRFLYLLQFVVFLYLHAVFVFKAPSKWTFGFGSQRGFRFEAKKKIARKEENTFLACYVLFSQFRHVMFSREFTFSSFINYAYICTCVRRHLDETVLWGNITWSEIGKQNIQAKKVYYFLSGNGPYEILFTLDEQISPTSLRL